MPSLFAIVTGGAAILGKRQQRALARETRRADTGCNQTGLGLRRSGGANETTGARQTFRRFDFRLKRPGRAEKGLGHASLVAHVSSFASNGGVRFAFVHFVPGAVVPFQTFVVALRDTGTRRAMKPRETNIGHMRTEFLGGMVGGGLCTGGAFGAKIFLFAFARTSTFGVAEGMAVQIGKFPVAGFRVGAERHVHTVQPRRAGMTDGAGGRGSGQTTVQIHHPSGGGFHIVLFRASPTGHVANGAGRADPRLRQARGGAVRATGARQTVGVLRVGLVRAQGAGDGRDHAFKGAKMAFRAHGRHFRVPRAVKPGCARTDVFKRHIGFARADAIVGDTDIDPFAAGVGVGQMPVQGRIRRDHTTHFGRTDVNRVDGRDSKIALNHGRVVKPFPVDGNGLPALVVAPCKRQQLLGDVASFVHSHGFTHNGEHNLLLAVQLTVVGDGHRAIAAGHHGGYSASDQGIFEPFRFANGVANLTADNVGRTQ